MLRQEIHKWFRKMFTKGANTDVQKDILPDGYYVDSRNMRITSVGGDGGSIEKIRGEEQAFGPEPDELDIADTYVCIGACVVSGHRVNFWASTNEDNPVIIKIDGVTMVRSTAIPYRYDRPLQFGDVSNARGGIVFPADHNSDPLFWDIPKIIAAYNAGSTQFTSGFDLAMVLVGPAAPAEWPKHTGLPVVGVGLPPGQYIYRLRYVTPNGDRTNFGPESPPISVPLVQDPAPNTNYPGGRTTGGESTTDLTPTSYGIEIKFRVDNVQEFQRVEVCRRRYNDAQGLNGPGIDEVVATLDIGPGENSVITFVDPVDANFIETIPPDQAQQQMVAFTAPKTVEHIDNRVVYGNFRKLDRLPSDVTFRRIEGRTVIPFTKSVTTTVNGEVINTGYTDPINNTYLRSYMRGERYGFGVGFWDGFSSKSFVKPIDDAENFQMPNRRDIKGGAGNYGQASLSYSDNFCIAATVNIVDGASTPSQHVAPTFEAFTQGSRQKTAGDIVNVMANQGPYAPWRPSAPSTDATGYNIKPNVSRITDYLVDSSAVPDVGAIWSPRYHALGILVSGVQNIPSWARVMTICRTEPAGRVVAQGLASYEFQEAPVSTDDPINKATNAWRWWSRDVHSGVVPEALWNDVQNNPANYGIQAVSPVGFYNETYGYWRVTNFGGSNNSKTARGADMLLYAGVQRDDQFFRVNAGDANAGNMGWNGSGGPLSPTGNWVGYGRWRHNTTSGSNNYWQGDTNGGNAIIGMAGITSVVEGRAQYWRLQALPSIYDPAGISTGGNARNFNDAGVRRFHQPFYAVNIVRDGADVRDLNIQNYIQVQHIHLASCVGFATDEPVQVFTLLNERLDDVRRRTDVTSDGERYVWVITPNGDEQAWVCISASAINVAQVLADIAANGFWLSPDGIQVYGVYNAFVDGQGDANIRFGLWGATAVPTPEAGSRIVVKYDDRAPIEVFGGDVTISPACHAVVDRSTNYITGEDGDTALPIGGLPLPYPGLLRPVNYRLPRTGTEPDTLQFITRITTLRQLAILWDAESRTPGTTELFDNPGTCAFPRQHYKIRPYAYDSNATSAQNGFYGVQYDADYPSEFFQWPYGGIPATNINGPGDFNLDYAKQPNITFLGLPRNGNNPVLEYPTGLIASLRQDPLQQDTPGLRTFIEDNIMVASDENGEIKRIISLDQGGFQQLWCWTERGVFRVPYNKNILTGASGEAIGTQSISQFWPREEIWTVRGSKGMPDQMWRMSVKANAPVDSGDVDTAFWVDRVSAYRLVGGQVMDIARGRYLKELQPILAGTPADNYSEQYCSLFNPKNGEWWIGVSVPGAVVGGVVSRPSLDVLVYSTINREWVGRFSYRHDQFMADDTKLYGYKELSEYTLDSGELINGQPIAAWVETAFAPYPTLRSELVSWRVNPDKPTEIQIFDRDHALMMTTNEAINGPLWAKLVDSWQQLVGRTDASYDPGRRRVQDTVFFVRIHHADPSRFVLTFADAQAKQIA